MQISKVPFSQFNALMRNAFKLSKKSALKVIIFDLSFAALIGIGYWIIALLFAVLSPILPKWLIIILGLLFAVVSAYFSFTLFARVLYSKVSFIWRIRNHETLKIKDLWRGLLPPVSLNRINAYLVLFSILLLIIAVLLAIFAPTFFKFSKIIFSPLFFMVCTIFELAVIAIVIDKATPKQALANAPKILKINVILLLIMPLVISCIFSSVFLLCLFLLPSKVATVIGGILYFIFLLYWQVILLNYDSSIYVMSTGNEQTPLPNIYSQPVITPPTAISRKKKIWTIITSFCVIGFCLLKLIQYVKPEYFTFNNVDTKAKSLDLRNPNEQKVKVDTQFNYYTNAIAVNLNNQAIKTIGVMHGAYYDKLNNGINGSTGWVESGFGILTFESSNGEFVIVGASGVNKNGEMIETAYQSLSELSSSESEIDRSSPIYHKLRVWIGGNGLKGSGEFKTLDELHIKSLNVIPLIITNVELSGGNKQTAFANFSYDDGRLSMTNSIRLLYQPLDRVFSQTINTESVASLPDLKGYGNVRNLREAMVLSPGLRDSVTAYMKHSYNDKQQKIDEIVQLWAATSTVHDTLASTLFAETNPPANKRRTNLSESDIAKLEVIEQFSGLYGGVQNFLDPDANSFDGRFRYSGVAPNRFVTDAHLIELTYAKLVTVLTRGLDQPASNVAEMQTDTSTQNTSNQEIFVLIQKHQDADAIKMLPNLNSQDKQDTAKFIESNVANMMPLYIFWLSEQKYQNKQLYLAAYYYLFARLRLMEDIKRCNDPSAGDGIFISIGNLAPHAIVYTTQILNHKSRYFIGKHVVHQDIKHPNQLSPKWVCIHGISAFSRDGIQIAPKSNWNAIYTEQRQLFIKMLLKSESTTTMSYSRSVNTQRKESGESAN